MSVNGRENCRTLEPLSMDDLLMDGAVYSINKHYDGQAQIDDMFDELNLGSDDEEFDDFHSNVVPFMRKSPWLGSFAELKSTMVPLSEYVCKRIVQEGFKRQKKVSENSRITVMYAGYWEGEEKAFDKKCRFVYDIRNRDILEGLEMAIESMCEGEIAEFWLAYNVLFGELGCPKRIKPRSDGFFIIHLISIEEAKEPETECSSSEPKTKFSQLIDEIRKQHKNGLEMFKRCMYPQAVREFSQAAKALAFCNLANEKEEKEQKELLIKLYTNLAVCYNKINKPQRTCIVCKELKRLTNFKPPNKALFHEGRALIMLREYKRARSLLQRLRSLEPNNEEVANELSIVEERIEQENKVYKEICRRAMGYKEEPKREEVESDLLGFETFEQNFLQSLEQFKSNNTANTLQLPGGLVDEEIRIIEILTKDFGFKLIKPNDEQDKYTVSKF